MIPKVLSIAGSDPSGGAGIQADLKTFSALGVYGMAALTSLTAQNTRGVKAVQKLPPAFVQQQIEEIFEDIAVHAVKIGMIASSEAAQILVDILTKFKPPNIVLDPVMVATSGDKLISETAIEIVKTKLLPLADLITPNIKEAEALLGVPFDGDMEMTARALRQLGAKNVLLKGGHLINETHSNDMLVTLDGTLHTFEAERILTANTHGTGCTLSSAIAAYLAKGLDLPMACSSAKHYLTGAIKSGDALGVGHGHGPVHHFWDVWKE
jgi:hydroxymethylpyrimidine/phosphomethylpyrimidine kinase